MNDNIISEIIDFALVGIIFLIVLFVFTKVTLKKYKLSTGKIKFYGLFLGLDNRSVLSFSLISLCYIFLIWCISNFICINIIYFSIIFIFILLSDILSKNYKKIPINALFSVIASLLITIIAMFYKYLTTENATIFTMIIFGLLIMFTFLLFTYYLFKLLNDIIIKNEHIRKKKYRRL